MIESLKKANQMLQQQQEEERLILEEKTKTITSLQEKIDEYFFF